jgi:hypothetical protein
MLVRAKAPHKVVKAFTGRRIVSFEWSPVPDGCEDEARLLASSGFVELQEQTEAKPEPEPFLQVELETEAPAVDLSSLSIPELRQIAQDQNVKGYARMSKAKLLEALNE